VFSELCQIVEATLEDYRAEGRPAPPPTTGIDIATLIQNNPSQS
jgi:hypothetical protein